MAIAVLLLKHLARASSIARYRPYLWNSILAGKRKEESDFASHVRSPILEYTIGGEAMWADLLHQVHTLLSRIKKRELKLS